MDPKIAVALIGAGAALMAIFGPGLLHPKPKAEIVKNAHARGEEAGGVAGSLILILLFVSFLVYFWD